MTIFLYIFEDGTVKLTRNSPQPEDLDSIADGVLQIFAIEGTVRDVDEDGNFVSMRFED